MNAQRKAIYLTELSKKAYEASVIPQVAYEENQVMRGLRNPDGTGVLVGLTDVGDVIGYKWLDGQKMAVEGELYYRGMSIADLVRGFESESRKGFEETVYLLLFGHLPSASELETFNALLDSQRSLPPDFMENMILKNPSRDIMNKLMRSVLVLYSYDENPDDLSIANQVKQTLRLVAQFPTIVAYGYQAMAHYFKEDSLVIHSPKTGVGTAENILHMIRKDSQYTQVEAQVLDLCLVLHAEHGGGNNSSFATHVVSSSATDIYSAITAAIGSLKGPKHGGANAKVKGMVSDLLGGKSPEKVLNEGLVEPYLRKIVEKEAFDGAGLIYGLGHAVYTLSDPRAELLRSQAKKLAIEKNQLPLFEVYEAIEAIGQRLLLEKRGEQAFTSANVDLYSGLVYQLLDIPDELFTPLFAIARVSSWCAHRMEQMSSDSKIMRPAFKSRGRRQHYQKLSERF